MKHYLCFVYQNSKSKLINKKIEKFNYCIIKQFDCMDNENRETTKSKVKADISIRFHRSLPKLSV
jgi:hypothetical protein